MFTHSKMIPHPFLFFGVHSLLCFLLQIRGDGSGLPDSWVPAGLGFRGGGQGIDALCGGGELEVPPQAGRAPGPSAPAGKGSSLGPGTSWHRRFLGFLLLSLMFLIT